MPKLKTPQKKGSPRKRDVILALDVSSSSSGFAVLRNGKWNKSKKSYGLIKTSNKLSLSERLVYFRDKLVDLLNVVQPTEIVIEDIFQQRNTKTLKLLARFSGVAIEVSRRTIGKDPVIVLTSKVRSTLGCGKSKQDAFDFICSKYKLDWQFDETNDITDALCLALYMRGNK